MKSLSECVISDKIKRGDLHSNQKLIIEGGHEKIVFKSCSIKECELINININEIVFEDCLFGEFKINADCEFNDCFFEGVEQSIGEPPNKSNLTIKRCGAMLKDCDFLSAGDNSSYSSSINCIESKLTARDLSISGYKNGIEMYNSEVNVSNSSFSNISNAFNLLDSTCRLHINNSEGEKVRNWLYGKYKENCVITNSPEITRKQVSEDI